MAEKLSPFEITGTLNEKKGVLDVSEVGYDAFVINRVMSNTIDTVLFANEMNRCWGADKQWQFDFYYYGLPKKKRYGKWHKLSEEKDAIKLIQARFGYSHNKAKDVLDILRPHLPQIEQELKTGGRNGKK